MDRNLADDAHFVTVRDVALRKESVDRNFAVSHSLPALKRRSPQGERG